jgi:hypothetical protein
MNLLSYVGVLHGCFVFGTLPVVLPYYSRKPHFAYLILVVTSYAILTVCSAHTVGRPETPSWKVVSIVAGWIIGDWAMWTLITESRRRG